MIRILIAEDQSLVRGALAALLDLEDDLTVVAQASDGDMAIDLAREQQPHIALVDVEMPKRSGLEVTQALSEHVPDCKIIIVTTFARPGYLQRALKAGARGYLLKDARVDELASAVRTVFAGGSVIDQGLMMAAWASDNPLTERELEVLRHAAGGLTTRELARVLFLSEGTVRNYLSDIMSKLSAASRQEAVRRAQESGWL